MTELWVTAASVAIVSGVAVLFWSMAAARTAGRQTIAVIDQRQERLRSGFAERALQPLVAAMAAQARRFTPSGWVETTEGRLQLAGSRWTLERTLAAKLGLGLGGLLFGLWWAGDAGMGSALVLGGLVAALTYFVPDLLLWGRARERQTLISRALPDTMDQLTICVESGLGFDAALKRVGRRGHGPLAEELHRTLNEIAVGVPRAEALGNLVSRTDVPELSHFVLAVRQANEYGLPVAQVLRVQAGQLRVKRRQAAEERALKMPVKIVFPLILCIFPALFVVLLGPAVIRIMRVLL
jgi:tight adherence protein C